MMGRDLKCVVCGAGAKDVAPDYELDEPPDQWLPATNAWAVCWTCDSGHVLITGKRTPLSEWQTMGPEAAQ